MFLLRFGITALRWLLTAVFLFCIVMPFYVIALHYQLEPPEPMGSFIGPVLGPGFVLRALLADVIHEGPFRDDLYGHAIVVLGSVVFWLTVLAGIRVGLRWLVGRRARASTWTAAAFLPLAGLVILYGFVMTGEALEDGFLYTMVGLLFAPGLFLSAMVSGNIHGGASGALGHIVAVVGSWVVWTVAVVLLWRVVRSFRSREVKSQSI
jgi:hypothetical protein